jgi:hypothetical protein
MNNLKEISIGIEKLTKDWMELIDGKLVKSKGASQKISLEDWSVILVNTRKINSYPDLTVEIIFIFNLNKIVIILLFALYSIAFKSAFE